MGILHEKAPVEGRLDQNRYESSVMGSSRETHLLQSNFWHFLLNKHGGTTSFRVGTPIEGKNFVLTGIGRQFLIVKTKGKHLLRFCIRCRKYVQVLKKSEGSYSIKPSPGYDDAIKLEIKAKDMKSSNELMKHSLKISIIVGERLLYNFYQAFSQREGVDRALASFQENGAISVIRALYLFIKKRILLDDFFYGRKKVYFKNSSYFTFFLYDL